MIGRVPGSIPGRSGVLNFCADSYFRVCSNPCVTADAHKDPGRRAESSGAVRKSRWPSWAFRPNEPYGFCGRKATCLGIGHSLSLICQPTSEDMKLYIIIIIMCRKCRWQATALRV